MDRYDPDIDGLFTEEILFILQRKRTALKVVRIGISVITLLFVAGSFLIRFIKKNPMIQDMYVNRVFIPAMIILFVITVFVVAGYIIRIRHLNRDILKFKQRREDWPSLWLKAG